MADIYDKEPDKKLNLAAREAGTQDGPERSNAQPSPDAEALNRAESQGAAAPEADTEPSSPPAESPQATDTPQSEPQPGALRGFVSRHGKLVGGATAGIVTVIVGILLWGLLPHHLQTVLGLYESRAFRSVMKNLDDASENLFEHYLRNKVLKSLSADCPSTDREKSCVPKIQSNDPISRAYNALSGANMEGRLAKQGFIFRRDVQGRLYMLAPGLPTDGVDISDFAEGRASLFDLAPIREADVRTALRKALSRETLFKRTFMRFQLRTLMKDYGVLRCIMACTVRENLREKAQYRKNAFRSFLYQRVLDPHDIGMREAIDCMFDRQCRPDRIADFNGPNGAPRTEFEVNLHNKRLQLATKYDDEKLAAIEKRALEVFKAGSFGQWILQMVLGKIGAKIASSSVPYVGQIDAAALVVEGIADAGPKVATMRYALVTADMVSMYTLFRTVADESKAGHVDALTMGSFEDALTTRSVDENGNRSNAESTPLYNGATGLPSEPVASLIDLLPSASAATGVTPGGYTSYRCNDDKPVVKGRLICQEESLKPDLGLIQTISDAIPPPLAAAASLWNKTAGAIFDWITSPLEFLNRLPGFASLQDLLAKATEPMAKAIANYLFPSPVSDKMSGGRTANVVGGGAFKVANDAAHFLLGGKVMTPPKFAILQQEALAAEREEFRRLPLAQRLFDKENPDSLVSRITLSLPPDIHNSVRSSFASIIVNPFTKILQTIASIFTVRPVTALAIQGNPWGDTTYGYESNDPIFNTDPEAYWKQNCADNKQTEAWHKNAVENINDETGQPENPTTNPCLLFQTTANNLASRFQPVGATAEESNR